MRRRAWYRYVAAFLAVWFPLIIVEPAALHTCPVHSAAVAGGSAGGMPHMHMGSGQSQQGAPMQGHDHTRCTCIGECSAGGLVAGIPALGVVLTSAPERRIGAVLPPVESPEVSQPPFFLPFANGPPGALRLA